MKRLRASSTLSGMTAIAALGIFAIAGAGCRHSDSQTVALRFWNGFTGPDGRTMLAIVKKFNAEHPDIQVRMQRMDWGTYYNKLFVAGLGKRAPEVFILHADNIERFARAGFVRPIDDLCAGQDGLDVSDILPNVWAATERQGRHFGVPLDVHPFGMYYNKTLFRKCGIVDAHGEAAPPRTRDEFMDALAKLTAAKKPNGDPQTWGMVFTWLRTNAATLMQQWGGRFFTPDYSACALNAPENVAALQFCVDLVQKHRYAPPPETYDSWIGFRQGNVGIVFEGIYMLGDLRRQQDLDYGAAPMPQIGPLPAAWAGSHVLCLREGLDDAATRAAWTFIAYLSNHALDWCDGGQIPSRASLLKTDRFQSMPAQSEFAKALPHIFYMPRVPFVFEFQTELDIAVEKALRRTASPQAALDAATARVNEIIARHTAWSAAP
ncbi:MAG TPA: ABC transporter substrate-binding protein [Candidatus Hydrogenedentes bacterium]|nr:ABC transporter substrate-binding protein [Candidatus Hydrogenedentota bacterium]HOS02142.1 ABC transporter substrate-binding protein [Candidatus Hydrogenedentota bacterium]